MSYSEEELVVESTAFTASRRAAPLKSAPPRPAAGETVRGSDANDAPPLCTGKAASREKPVAVSAGLAAGGERPTDELRHHDGHHHAGREHQRHLLSDLEAAPVRRKKYTSLVWTCSSTCASTMQPVRCP